MGAQHKGCRRKSRRQLEESKESSSKQKERHQKYSNTLLLDPLEEKYEGPIKLDAVKLVDLKNLKNFLETRAGKAWVDEVVAQQLNAVPIENIVDEHEATSAENMADDDFLEYDTVPLPI